MRQRKFYLTLNEKSTKKFNLYPEVENGIHEFHFKLADGTTIIKKASDL